MLASDADPSDVPLPPNYALCSVLCIVLWSQLKETVLLHNIPGGKMKYFSPLPGVRFASK